MAERQMSDFGGMISLFVPKGALTKSDKIVE